MKILQTDVDVGNMVLVEEKYDVSMHHLKHNRIHLGFIVFIDSSKNFAIARKMLVEPKQKQVKRFRDFFKLCYNIGIVNYGGFGQTMFNESQIKSIKILK